MVTNGDKKWLPQLKALWHATYGDSGEEIELFFQNFFNEKACWCYVAQGRPVSVIYGIPASVTAVTGETPRPVWYLYAGATAVAFRSCGYYRQVIERAVTDLKGAGGQGPLARAVAELNGTGNQPPLILLVPAGGLVDYYGKIGFQTALQVEELYITRENFGNIGLEAVGRLDAPHYRQLRDKIFGGTGYVAWDERFLSYAIGSVESQGGSALEIVARGRRHILLARPFDGALHILETSMDDTELAGCGRAITRRFGCSCIRREGITVMSVGKTGMDRLYFRIALDG